MPIFNKVYNVKMTDNQKASLKEILINSGYLQTKVNIEKRDITMTVNREQVSGGIAVEVTEQVKATTIPLKTVYIGKNGGIHENIDHSY